jgi:hypothetical protein
MQKLWASSKEPNRSGNWGAVLEGAELALGEGAVVVDMRAAVRLGDAEVGQ